MTEAPYRSSRVGHAWATTPAELRDQRLRLGLTQADMARRLGQSSARYPYETPLASQAPYGVLQHLARLLDERHVHLVRMAREPQARHTANPAELRALLRLGEADWTDRMVTKLWKEGTRL